MSGRATVPVLARDDAELHGTLVELPELAAVAQQKLASEPRASVAVADALVDPIPRDHDTVLVANLVHLFSEDQVHVLFAKLREAAAEDATLMLVDFLTDPTGTEPPFAALMAGESFMHSGGAGRSYGEHELRGWLHEAGWEPLDRRELAGPQSALVARAV